MLNQHVRGVMIMSKLKSEPAKKYSRARMYVTADGFMYAKPEEIINSKEFEKQRRAVKYLRLSLSTKKITA